MTKRSGRYGGNGVDDELKAGFSIPDASDEAQDEDGASPDGDYLTEEILARIFSSRFVPWKPTLKEKDKVAWLTKLPLLEHKSKAFSPTFNRFALVNSNARKPFKITSKSVAARDMDITATSAFDMAMTASLNPAMQKKGVTITAERPEALFLLYLAAQEMGLRITNEQQIAQAAQMHPDALRAAQQQWSEALPCLKKAFDELNGRKADEAPRVDPEAEQGQQNPPPPPPPSGDDGKAEPHSKEKTYSPDDPEYEFTPADSGVKRDFSAGAAGDKGATIDGEYEKLESGASTALPPPTQPDAPPQIPPPA